MSKDSISRRLRFFSVATSSLLSQIAYSVDTSCPPYLIDNNQLTAILKSNLEKAPLSNARASTKPRTNCEIELSATVDILNVTVNGCTSPIHDDYSIGLSDIKIHTALREITIPSVKSNIKNKIAQHCGRDVKIKTIRTQADGILVVF